MKVKTTTYKIHTTEFSIEVKKKISFKDTSPYNLSHVIN